MIESLAKALEASKEILKKSSFDPDKRIQALDKDTVKKFENKSFDPDKRIEPSQKLQKSEKEKYDPDKRIETHSRNEYNQILNQNGELIENGVKYDDNGKVYSVDSILQPNLDYELNGYKYKTDDKGRIIKIEGMIKIPSEKLPRPRLPDILDRDANTDDRGHLIAREFGGADTEGNLVPMDSEVNQRGEYRKLEQELRKNIEEGSEVQVDIEPQYEGTSHRPSEFIVSYKIDGDSYEKVITNRRETNA